MATVRLDRSIMPDIASAIREQNGMTTEYYPSEMAAAILAFPAGERRLRGSAAALVDRTITECIDSDGECTTIGTYAFYYCTSLQTVSFPVCTTIGSYAFEYCSALQTASFPACTTIRWYAFEYCLALQSVSFPACTTIGSYAFQRCSALESFYLLGSSLCTLSASNVFGSTPMSLSSYLGYFGSIFVPSSLYESYITANNWSYYSKRIVGVDPDDYSA